MILLYILLFLIMACTWRTRYHIYTKGLCSFGFILTAYLSHQTKLFLLILPGLLAFMIGDLLLCKKNLFKYGLNAFLIGDIACLFFYYRYLPFNYIELKTEITSYTFALVWLTTKSILTALSLNTLNFRMMSLGFILYLLSVVLLVFYKKNNHQILGLLNIFFYYFGIFLTAYSFSFI